MRSSHRLTRFLDAVRDRARHTLNRRCPFVRELLKRLPQICWRTLGVVKKLQRANASVALSRAIIGGSPAALALKRYEREPLKRVEPVSHDVSGEEGTRLPSRTAERRPALRSRKVCVWGFCNAKKMRPTGTSSRNLGLSDMRLAPLKGVVRLGGCALRRSSASRPAQTRQWNSPCDQCPPLPDGREIPLRTPDLQRGGYYVKGDNCHSAACPHPFAICHHLSNGRSSGQAEEDHHGLVQAHNILLRRDVRRALPVSPWRGW